MRRVLWVVTIITVSLVILGGLACAAERIVWWHWNNPEAEEAFRPAVEAFTKATGIEVEAQMVDWGELKNKLLVAIGGGVAPDVTAVTSTWSEEVALMGAFEPLNQYIKVDTPTFWRDIFPSSMQVWQLEDGTQYAVPFDNDIPVLFYNKNLFQENGVQFLDEFTNWDDWLDATTKLTRDLDGDGLKDYYGMTNWWYNWYPLVWANGGEYFRPDKRANLSAEPVRQALEFYSEFFPPKRGLLNQWDELKHVGYDPAAKAYPAHAFLGGRVGIAPAGAWMPTYYIWDSTKGDWAFEFDAAPMPLSYAGRRATSNEGQANAVLAGSKHKEAAFLFAKWLSDAQAQRIAASRGQFPVRRSVALQANLFLAKDTFPANRNYVIAAAEYCRPWPKGVNWPVTSAEIAKLRDYFNGKLSLDAAITNVTNLVEAKLRELKILK